MNDPAVHVCGLRIAYGRQEVLRGVDLEVPAGSVFGLLGRNGAGKTTTIKALLGLLRPAAGRCRVLGIDVATNPYEVRRRVGYLAEDQSMYGWMTVGEICRWVGSFYPVWDEARVSSLLVASALPSATRVGALSKGQNTMLAFVLAVGHRPRLVILDDPTLGLDPIARKAFLRRVVDELQGEGVTVLFSSHLLYEIEPVADHVAILDRGTIVKTGATEALCEQVRRFVFRPRPDTDAGALPGLLDLQRRGEVAAVTVESCNQAVRADVRSMAVGDVQEQGLNLDEIFEAYVIGNRRPTP